MGSSSGSCPRLPHAKRGVCGSGVGLQLHRFYVTNKFHTDASRNGCNENDTDSQHTRSTKHETVPKAQSLCAGFHQHVRRKRNLQEYVQSKTATRVKIEPQRQRNGRLTTNTHSRFDEEESKASTEQVRSTDSSLSSHDLRFVFFPLFVQTPASLKGEKRCQPARPHRGSPFVGRRMSRKTHKHLAYAHCTPSRLHDVSVPTEREANSSLRFDLTSAFARRRFQTAQPNREGRKRTCVALICPVRAHGAVKA